MAEADSWKNDLVGAGDNSDAKCVEESVITIQIHCMISDAIAMRIPHRSGVPYHYKYKTAASYWLDA